MDKFPFFYALHGRWAGGDWRYKIYVTPDALYGAVVAVQFAQRRLAQRPAVPTGAYGDFIASPTGTPPMMARYQFELAYDRLAPDGLELLTTDARNFCFASDQIQEIRLVAKSHWWTMPLRNGGTMRIHSANGQKMWFLFDSTQDISRVAELLRSITPQVIFSP